MANKEHMRILRRGTRAWNEWRAKNPDVRPNFLGANLSGIKIIGGGLRRADFRGAILSKAILSGSTLVEADLRGANLCGANLCLTKLMKADLSGANLSGANLFRADLEGATLREANLSHANLRAADLCGAYLTRANLAGADFSNSRLNGASLWNAIINETDFKGADISRVRIKKSARSKIETGPHLERSELEREAVLQVKSPDLDVIKADRRIEETEVAKQPSKMPAALLNALDGVELSNEISEEVDKLTKKGRVMFNPPEEMRVYKKERIEVRITQNIEEDLTQKLKGRGYPQIEKILVGSVMKASLSGDDFKIEVLSDEEQALGLSKHSQWEWNVTPLKAGKKLLYLSISISIILKEFGEKKQSLPVMEKKIHVKVNLSGSLIVFIKKRWVAIITFIISLLGLIIAYMQFIKK